jgi:hypothetical protein
MTLSQSHVFVRQEDTSMPISENKESDSVRTAALLRDILDKPLDERIRSRAYELYVLRGKRDNRAEQDWYDAERNFSQTDNLDCSSDDETFPCSKPGGGGKPAGTAVHENGVSPPFSAGLSIWIMPAASVAFSGR